MITITITITVTITTTGHACLICRMICSGAKRSVE